MSDPIFLKFDKLKWLPVKFEDLKVGDIYKTKGSKTTLVVKDIIPTGSNIELKVEALRKGYVKGNKKRKFQNHRK